MLIREMDFPIQVHEIDEFDYEGSPNIDKWHHQTIPPNNGSWWNDELQHYTDRLENSLLIMVH